MEYIALIWKFFLTNILTKPAFFIGFMVLIGYILLKKPWYEILSGTLKACLLYTSDAADEQ